MLLLVLIHAWPLLLRTTVTLLRHITHVSHCITLYHVVALYHCILVLSEQASLYHNSSCPVMRRLMLILQSVLTEKHSVQLKEIENNFGHRPIELCCEQFRHEL